MRAFLPGQEVLRCVLLHGAARDFQEVVVILHDQDAGAMEGMRIQDLANGREQVSLEGPGPAWARACQP